MCITCVISWCLQGGLKHPRQPMRMLHARRHIHIHSYVCTYVCHTHLYTYNWVFHSFVYVSSVYRYVSVSSLKRNLVALDATYDSTDSFGNFKLYSQPNDNTRCLQNRTQIQLPQPWQQSTTIVSIQGIMSAAPLAFDCTRRKTEALKTRTGPHWSK